MSIEFNLLRSKQSEDVSALSIVGNKNSASIEVVIRDLYTKFETMQGEIAILQNSISTKFDELLIDLSTITVSQSIGDFAAIVSSSVEATKTVFQVYVTYLGQNFDFTEKMFKAIHKELLVKSNFVRINSTSVIMNFDVAIADLNDTNFKMFIHS